ncbi:prealbumin-like fold domain-containing protein [Comamonas humi]
MGAGNGYNCVAADSNGDSLAVASNVPCVIGSQVGVPVTISSSGTSAQSRYDVGVWFSNPAQANSCQVFPTSPAPNNGSTYLNLNNDLYGDAQKNVTSSQTFASVQVQCQPQGDGSLKIPAMIYWGNQESDVDLLEPSAKSKCSRPDVVAPNYPFLGQITVTKKAPTATNEAFDFSVSAGQGGSVVDPASPNFSLGNNGSQVITAAVSQGGLAYTVTETPLAGWNFQGAQCSDMSSGAAVPLATTPATNGVTINLSHAVHHVSCEFTNTKAPAAGTVTVLKSLTAGDPGLFDLSIQAGQSQASVQAIGNGGTVSLQNVAAGASVQVGEAANGSTSLANYTSALSCTGVQGVSGTTSGSFTMPEGGAVACTFTNTRKTNTVTVKKTLAPTDDDGRFNLLVNGTVQATNIGNNGSTAAVGTPVGSTVQVGEAGYTGTDLANYSAALSCTWEGGSTTASSFTMPNAPVTCTYTNTRKTNTVTVKKLLAPGNDSGKFNLQVNGTTQATDVGNNGSTAAIVVPAGSTAQVAELAGTGANLANYNSSLACTGVSGVTGTTDSSFTVPLEGAVVCTFSNTRKAAPPAPAAIPTLGMAGLAAMSGLLGLAALLVRRRSVRAGTDRG